MGLFNRLFGGNKQEELERIPSSKDLDKNLQKIKEILKDCDDVVYREVKVGKEQKYRCVIVFIDGLVDKNLIHENLFKPLMHVSRDLRPSPSSIKENLFDLIKYANISAGEINEVESINEAIDSILIGETVVIIDKYKKIMTVSSRGWQTRGISEPQSETVIRGPRDGFTETIKTNISSVRRRIRDPRLKLKMMQIGERSKTDVALMYMEDIVNEEILEEVKKRIEGIKIDAVIESSYIEQFIEDDRYSIFPQVENTERPDSVSAALYEGRVAILVDNTPFALLVPTTIATFMQSSEDYYDRWPIATLIRIIRYIGAFVALLSPALYIAITSYHPGMLPTALALYVASTRIYVPFPAYIEAFIMEITIEFLREAGTRLSGPIGTTIGIVGGLVIGQAAVEAGIVSPLMIIIVALTTIATFMLPSYGFSGAFRIIRFMFMVFAAVFGLYGIMLALILLGTHLVRLKSFGVPYMSPFIIMGKTRRDIQDTFVRTPLSKMEKRPKFTNVIDEERQPDGKSTHDKKGEE